MARTLNSDRQADAILLVARELCGIREHLVKQTDNNAILCRLAEMEERIMITVSQIKAAVAAAKQSNREAFTEIGTKIADLNKQITDLIAGVGDPEVTDEAFERDLKDLQTDAKALADIVPGSPTPEPPVE